MYLFELLVVSLFEGDIALLVDGLSHCVLTIIAGVFSFIEAPEVVLVGGLFLSLLLIRVISQRSSVLNFCFMNDGLFP